MLGEERGWDRCRERFWVGISKPCDRHKSCLPHTQGTACERGGRLPPLLVPSCTAPLPAQVLGSHLLELLPSILCLPPGLPLLTPPAPGGLRMKHSESIMLSLINLLWLPSPRTKPTLFSLAWPAARPPDPRSSDTSPGLGLSCLCSDGGSLPKRPVFSSTASEESSSWPRPS